MSIISSNDGPVRVSRGKRLGYLALAGLTLALSSAGVAATPVFINEIHYDNAGADTGEAVEIAGPAGTSLNGWSLVLYNGSGGSSYNTINLSGSLADSCGGLGTLSFATTGLQNGSPDGLALVDNSNTVVQFLSYEGDFIAVGGPADGLQSENIGVSESSSTPVGQSLQLTGDGTQAEDFSWTGPIAETFDNCNTGQSFGGVAAAPELLLSEVVVTPTAGEFVEIYNPGSQAFDLTDVYLTDATFAPGGVFYYNIVLGADAGGGGFGDFHARFPAGASIGPGEYQTIALAGSDDFVATYGVTPTYELYEDGAGTDLVPDMLEALPGSINNQGGLTNSGEVVVLYQWDGQSDLVADLDYALWGDRDEAVDKTGVGTDGPDGDMVASFYQDDTTIGQQDVIAGTGHAFGDAFGRIDLDEGSEIQSGGNGVNNDDETSENLSITWASREPSPNAATPAPPPPPATVVLNEFQADPASGDAGDANGDGTRNGSEDEFIELVNISGGDLDISGWTVSDAVTVRHTFPAGTVLTSECAIVVFGGGSPSGAFGNALVQTASGGFLGLNNGGDVITINDGFQDVVTVSYGGEGGNNQSLTLDPDVTGTDYVQHTSASGSGGTRFSPGTLIDGAAFAGCDPIDPVVAEIFEIQGSGADSPLDGQLVTSNDNIVTAVGPEGFFMQTPADRSDNNADTSDGIYVFTGGAPGVAVGDQVDVTGTVDEFFGFTEITGGPTINVDSGGNVVPAAVVFDLNTPSPDPANPSCAIEYECYEGMLIDLPLGTVAGPNQGFGSDPIAEIHVVAGTERPFREPGIEFPGLPGLPVWDGNPEVFELDPNKLGLPNSIIPAGSTVAARGGLGFEFGGYELWPSELVVVEAPILDPVRDPVLDEMTVGSLNLLRLFDNIDDPNVDDPVIDPAEFAVRLEKFSRYIREVLKSPDILAVQEVESLSVLQTLAATIAADDASVNYSAFLEEGNDIGGIDVGFLVRDTVTVDAVTQLGADEILTVDGSLLHDRPPLVLEGRYTAGASNFPIVVMAVHNRSLGGIDTSDRVRQKRLQQAQSIAEKVQTIQGPDGLVNLVVTGDFNAFQFTDGYVDVVGQIRGDVNPADNLLSAPELVSPELINQIQLLPAEERYSFIFRGNAQALDHALTTVGLDPLVAGMAYGRGNTDAAEILLEDPTTPLGSSDHDGLVLFVTLDGDQDGVTDSADLCPGTVIPEMVPTVRLGTLRWALTDGDGNFDTVRPNGNGPQDSFTIEDTGGCSCEQIIDALDLGKGHTKFGCSLDVMREWSAQATP